MSLAFLASHILLLSTLHLPGCHGYEPPSVPVLTAAPGRLLRLPRRNHAEIDKRILTSQLSTCGYEDGDPERVRSANSGFNCRVDTQNGLWGFCATTIVSATDCGMVGCCVDTHTCSDGCGLTDRTDMTTFTCESNSFCSLALLTFGVDQEYSYISCGPKPTTVHYLISPTAQIDAKITSLDPAPSGTETTPPQTGDTSGQPGAASETDPAAAKGEQTRSNMGAIAGGVIGSLVLIFAFGLAIIYLLQRHRGRQQEEQRSKLEGSPEYPLQPLSDEEVNKAQLIAAGGWRPSELPAQHGSIQRPAEMSE